jgi:lipopolysaccharide transport system permease protein
MDILASKDSQILNSACNQRPNDVNSVGPTNPTDHPGISGKRDYQIPDNPLVVIEASKSWVALNLRDLWSYRELLYFLTLRDVKVRYKQTVLGIGWAILQPFLTMIIFTVFFGRLAGIKTDDIPYPLFAFAGLVPWTFFANSISNSGNSLVGSANLITKVYFPRMLIPGASVAAGLADFALAFLILIGMMFYYGAHFSWSILMLPFLIGLLTILALGVGMWMSALNVKYRDIRYALPFVIQLWMFVSAVIYPSSLAGGKLRLVLRLNPVVGIIENFRAALFGKSFDLRSLAFSILITIVLFVYSTYSFRRMEKSFADIV